MHHEVFFRHSIQAFLSFLITDMEKVIQEKIEQQIEMEVKGTVSKECVILHLA